MKLEYGNMWDIFNESDLFLVTTNSYINRFGHLVMGRGMAQQAALRFPDLPKQFADLIGSDRLGIYGLAMFPSWPKKKIGAFQVKINFAQPAIPDVIKKSTTMLGTWCMYHPDVRVDLNYPGIGNGHMNRFVVEPIIASLPDQVHVWQLEELEAT